MVGSSSLQWKIDKARMWRKKELSLLFLNLPENVDSAFSKCYRRQALLLLYAHLEGFAKDSATLYLEAVSGSAAPPMELNPALLGIVLKRRLARPGLAAIEFADLYLKMLEDCATLEKLPVRGVIKTRSNLSWKIFKNIVETIGLDPMVFLSYRIEPIGRLLAARNGIAHGEGRPVEDCDYRAHHASVIELIDKLSDELIDNFGRQAFLRVNIC